MIGWGGSDEGARLGLSRAGRRSPDHVSIIDARLGLRRGKTGVQKRKSMGPQGRCGPGSGDLLLHHNDFVLLVFIDDREACGGALEQHGI